MDESVQKHLEMSATAKRLLKAAALIEDRGHCRGAAEGADGSLCVIAAITEADRALGGSGWEATYYDPVQQLRRALKTLSIVRWNDSAPTAEVIAKLRAVALGG